MNDGFDLSRLAAAALLAGAACATPAHAAGAAPLPAERAAAPGDTVPPAFAGGGRSSSSVYTYERRVLEEGSHTRLWSVRLETTFHDAHGVAGTQAIAASEVVLHWSRPEIVGVRPTGYWRLTEERAGRRRELEIMPTPDGGMQQRYTVNGVAAPYDAAARAWLAEALREHAPPAPR